MKTQLLCSVVVGVISWAAYSGVAASAVPAETAADSPMSGSERDADLLGEGKPIAKNRLSLSYRLGMNITADFRKLGGFAALTDPGPDTGARADRNYDNGYNRVDITGNDHEPGFPDTTWNWGFQGGGAVQGNSLVFQSASSPANASSPDNDNGVNHGFELSYQREFWREAKWRGGLEAAFGFTTFRIRDTRVLQNEVDLITDTFTVPGGVEALPGYPFGPTDSYGGSYGTPGALLGTSLDAGQRVRSVVSQITTITGQRELDTSVYLFRLGPYVELPLNEKLALFVNGGLNLAIGDTKFSFSETVTYDGSVRATRNASRARVDLLVGGYVGGGLSYALNAEWGVFAGAQFQTAGRSTTTQGGKEAVLNMGQTIVVTMGVSYGW